MPAEVAMDRAITVEQLKEAVHFVVFGSGPATREAPEPPCQWPDVCGKQGCTYPRYSRNGAPSGLIGKILIQLGYPVDLVLALDREYELGDILHPGVRIGHSRNAALARISEKGMALLTFLQEHQKTRTWGELSIAAFGPRKLLAFRDAKRRPWRY